MSRPSARAASLLCTASLLACATARPAPALQEPELRVSVDPRVELLCVIYRLAGFDEYRMGRLEPYQRAIELHFGFMGDHPAVELARTLRGRGLGFDAAMLPALHAEDGLGWAPRAPLDTRGLELYQRPCWDPETAARFFGQVRAFAADSAFDEFLEAQAELYAEATARMQALLDEHLDLEWFGRFFGAAPSTPFELVVGLQNGPANYGPKFRAPDGTEHLYAILGAARADADGVPVFDESMLSTVVHEFCHSFANPLLDARRAELEPAGRAIFAPVAESMRRQAYGEWPIVLNESLVRACEVRYAHAHGGDEAAATIVAYQVQQGFPWTAELDAVLAAYEAERERYPTLESYMPKVAAFFADLAPRVPAMVGGSEDR